MQNMDIIKIIKSLESERNWYLQNSQANKLNEKVILMQINIFYTTYTLSLFDEEGRPPQTIKSLYKDFYTSRFNGIRFLLELFLTSLEIATKENETNEYSLIYSLALSEKINFHALDRRLLQTDPTNADYLATVKAGIQGYSAFLQQYKKPSNKIPDSLEAFFPTALSDPLRYRKSGESSFVDEFGFPFYRQGKLNFGSIIQNNPEIDNLFTYLREEKIFNANINKKILRDIYSIYSNEIHPTISSLEMFEGFISENEEKQSATIITKRGQNETFLKVIGILMDTLYKNRRQAEIKASMYEE